MRLILCSVTLALLACAARAGDNVPGAGEIAVYGQVVSANTGRGALTVNVSRYRTSQGETCLNPPQPRVVEVGERATLSFLGKSPYSRSPIAGDFQPGRKVYAVGPDSGAGSALVARWVEIEASAAPPQPPAGAPTPAPTAPARRGLDFGSPLSMAGVTLLALASLGGVLLARKYLRH